MLAMIMMGKLSFLISKFNYPNMKGNAYVAIDTKYRNSGKITSITHHDNYIYQIHVDVRFKNIKTLFSGEIFELFPWI
jgi:hypothetical protein